MANRFSKKLLSFQFSLGQGSNKAGSASTANVTTTPPTGANVGIRASCHITINGGDMTSGSMEAAIYGMPQATMNQLTTLGTQINAQGQNTVTVQAGDDSGMATVFQGSVWDAFMDGNSEPQVPFRFRSIADQLGKMKPAPSTSVAGSADVATLMKQLAGTLGLSFENNGVNVKVSNPYLSGGARIQVGQLARMAGVQVLVDKGTLAIWPPGGSRSGSALQISTATGMVGYPKFYSAQVIVRTVFDPSIKFGGQMQIQSDITAACGLWSINKTEFDLESFMPRGKWFATLWGIDGKQTSQVNN